MPSDTAILFDGSKTFWKTRTVLKIQIIHHIQNSCLELVCFDSSINTEFRMYLDVTLIRMKLDKDLITRKCSEKKELLLRQRKPVNEDKIIHDVTMDLVMQYAFVRIHVPSDYPLGVAPVTLLPSFDDVPQDVHSSKRRIDVECDKPEDLIPHSTSRQATVVTGIPCWNPPDSNKYIEQDNKPFVASSEDMHSSYMLAVGTSPRNDPAPLRKATWGSSRDFPVVTPEPTALTPLASASGRKSPLVPVSPSNKVEPLVVTGNDTKSPPPLLRRSTGNGSRNQLAGFFQDFMSPSDAAQQEEEQGRESPNRMPELANRPPALQVARSLPVDLLTAEIRATQSMDSGLKNPSAKTKSDLKVSPSGVAGICSTDSADQMVIQINSSGSNDSCLERREYVQNEHWTESEDPLSPGGIAAHRENGGSAFHLPSMLTSHGSPVPLHRNSVRNSGVLSPKSVPPLSPAIVVDKYSNLLPALRIPGSGPPTGVNSARSSRGASPSLGSAPLMSPTSGEHTTPRSFSNRPLSASKSPSHQRATCESPSSGRLSGRSSSSLVERVKALRENSQGVIDIAIGLE